MNSIYTHLTPFNNSKKVLVQDQNVSDIIGAMLQAHNQYAPEYNKIARNFEGRNVKSTARNIYQFLKKNVNYVVEPDEKQTIKSPSAILYTGKSTGSDCKNYSLFTAGVGLWLIYGLVIEKWPLILANAITFALALSILILKLRHTSKDRK